RRRNRRRTLLIAGAIVVLIAIVFAFLPDPVPVDVALVERDSLRIIVEEEGETRIEDRYVVTAPVAGYVRRIDLEPGDIVTEGMMLVQLEPPRAPLLDPRVQAEALAQVTAAAAAVDDAAVVLERAVTDRERMESLYAAGAIPRQELDIAVADAERTRAALEARRSELAAARAAARTGPAVESVLSVVHAPVAGRVLTVHRTSEGSVNAGEP